MVFAPVLAPGSSNDDINDASGFSAVRHEWRLDTDEDGKQDHRGLTQDVPCASKWPKKYPRIGS